MHDLTPHDVPVSTVCQLFAMLVISFLALIFVSLLSTLFGNVLIQDFLRTSNDF